MKARPAFIAALPREVAAFVKGWPSRRPRAGVTVWTKDDAVVVCAGMGAARATLAVQAALAAMPVTHLISIGVAGACDPALQVGDIVHAGAVIDSATGERFDGPRHQHVLVTTNTIASVAEKARLYASYRAAAVDMEAATIARQARAHGLPFAAIKAISDGSDFELAELSRFATPEGQFRETAFAAYAAVRPWVWPKLISLAGNSARAIAALTRELHTQLDWYRQQGS